MTNRFFIQFITLTLCILCLAGCGGGGSGSTGQSQSTTVALQAEVKSGTPMGVFSTYSSSSWGPSMNFTLKSFINPNAGAMASDVNITSEVISYEYVEALPVGAGSTLIIPPLNYTMNMIVPAGGTKDFLNVPVLSPTQKLYINNNTASSDRITYKVNVTFNGYEVKNGNNVSVSATGNIFRIP